MIDAIENSAYAIWVRESPSIWAFTTILSLHAMGLAIIVGINTIIALRLLGYVPTIPVASLRKLYPWMYVGFTINAFSGLSLLAANLDNDIRNPMFLTKLSLIALAMINLELTRAKVFDDPLVVCLGKDDARAACPRTVEKPIQRFHVPPARRSRHAGGSPACRNA